MRLERKFEAALIRELAVERWEMEAVDEEKPLTTGKVHAANWTGALDAVVFHYDRNAIDIERRRLHGVRLRRRARVKRSGRPFLLSVALYEKGDYRCRRCSMTVATRSASAGSPRPRSIPSSATQAGPATVSSSCSQRRIVRSLAISSVRAIADCDSPSALRQW